MAGGFRDDRGAPEIASGFARRGLGRIGVGSRVWIAVLIGSTVGGFVPALWGGELLSYAGVLFSGVGAVVGLWIADRTR